MAIVTGAKTIGFSNRPYDVPATLPTPADAPQAVLDDLIQRLTNVEILAQGKADANSIRSLIAFSDEDVLISGRNIVLNGAVTFTDIVNEQNGTTSGLVDPLITRIIGDRIQTGSITSNNWGTTQGTAIDLDNETVTFGGSANPKLFFDGTDLFIEGTINAGVIQSIGFGASEGIQIDLDNETITAGGSSSPKLYYDGAGNLSITGTISSSSIDATTTLNGTATSTVVSNAADGLDIHDKLLEGGTAVLTGVINPTNTGALAVGSITWDGTTGALTGGTGIAITEFGIIGANAGSATFTLEAATGDATFAGTLAAGAIVTSSVTIDGVAASTLVSNAADGLDIHDKLLSGGTAILTGVIQPTNTGALAVGTITWNSTTGALTGGTGIAITEFGIIGASSGSATFTIEAATGDATFAGDIVTSGQVYADGSTTTDGLFAAIIGEPTTTSRLGVLGISGSAAGVYGKSTSGAGVYGTSSSNDGVEGVSGTGNGVYGICNDISNPNTGAGGFFEHIRSDGVALRVDNGRTVLDGDLSVGDDLTVGDTATIDGTLDVTGVATFDSDVTLGNSGADTITVIGDLEANNNVTLGGSSADLVTVKGVFQTNSNTTLGNSSSDPITVSGKLLKSNVSGHLLRVYNATTNALEGTFRYEFV